MLSKNQKGIIHLGIFGILFLVGAIAVGTKVVSNPELLFNINEKAGEATEECIASGGKWLSATRKCLKSEKSGNANEGGGKNVEECVQKGGQCLTSCAGTGLVNSEGDCNKGVCCRKRVPDPEPEKPDVDCLVGEPDNTVPCFTATGCATSKGEISQRCVAGKWKSFGTCSCTSGSSGGSPAYCSQGQTIDCEALGKKCEPTSGGGKCAAITQITTPYCSDFMKNDCRQESKDCEPTSTGGKCVAKSQSTTPSCSQAKTKDCLEQGKNCQATVNGGTCVDKTGSGGYHCQSISGGEYSVPANPSRENPAQKCGYGCIAATGRCRTGEQAREERAGKTWYKCLGGFSIENGYNQYGNAYIGNIDYCGYGCNKTDGRCYQERQLKGVGETCRSGASECQSGKCGYPEGHTPRYLEYPKCL